MKVWGSPLKQEEDFPRRERRNLKGAPYEIEIPSIKEEEEEVYSEMDSDVVDYETWRANLPKNLRTETEDYNLKGAYEGGLQPVWDEGSQSYHLSSVNPETGEWLKSMDHPSAWMEYKQHSMSMDPYHREHRVTVNPEGHFGKKTLQYVKKDDK